MYHPEWLAEPKKTDNTWGRYDESVPDWLQRSTLPRAQAARQFLRKSIAEMPPSYRDYFTEALRDRDRWDSTFHELILARMVQLLGGQFCMEQQNAEGKRPDFHADFGEHQVTIEAISPKFEREADQERFQDFPLLKFINEHAPSGWSISVNQLPHIGRADPQKEFKRVLLQLFQELPTEPEERWYTATRQLSSGRLQLRLFPAVLGHAPIVSGPMYSYSYKDAEARIRHAIQKKRKQVRAETRPVLLAVHASGFGATFEDFDCALFGRTLTLVGCNGHSMTTQFEANGLFAKPGKDQPTYAGVLAFKRLSFKYTGDPVMYFHPRFNGYLPAELLQFEQRRLQRQTELASDQQAVNTYFQSLALFRMTYEVAWTPNWEIRVSQLNSK